MVVASEVLAVVGILSGIATLVLWALFEVDGSKYLTRSVKLSYRGRYVAVITVSGAIPMAGVLLNKLSVWPFVELALTAAVVLFFVVAAIYMFMSSLRPRPTDKSEIDTLEEMFAAESSS